MAKKEHGGKPEVVRISFEPAEGGLVSETHMKYKRGGQGGGPDYDHETERGIHSTMEDAQAHLEEHFGKHFGAKKAAKAPEPPEAEE